MTAVRRRSIVPRATPKHCEVGFYFDETGGELNVQVWQMFAKGPASLPILRIVRGSSELLAMQSISVHNMSSDNFFSRGLTTVCFRLTGRSFGSHRHLFWASAKSSERRNLRVSQDSLRRLSRDSLLE